MKINSVTSFLAPLNQSRASAEKAQNIEVGQTSGAYILDLSDTAKNMMAAKAADVRKSVSAPANFDNQVKNAQKALTRLLLSHNLDPNADMDFKIENGRIVLNDKENPDKEAIERVLNENAPFLSEMQDVLNKAEVLAQEKLQTNYKIALEDDENKDDEEKKLALTQKMIEFSKQVASVANSFSVSSGTMSFASINMASSLVF